MSATRKEWEDALHTMRAVIVHSAFAYSQASGEAAPKLEADFNRTLDIILARASPPCAGTDCGNDAYPPESLCNVCNEAGP